MGMPEADQEKPERTLPLRSANPVGGVQAAAQDKAWPPAATKALGRSATPARWQERAKRGAGPSAGGGRGGA